MKLATLRWELRTSAWFRTEPIDSQIIERVGGIGLDWITPIEVSHDQACGARRYLRPIKVATTEKPSRPRVPGSGTGATLIPVTAPPGSGGDVNSRSIVTP
jgi:hypothetical protein